MSRLTEKLSLSAQARNVDAAIAVIQGSVKPRKAEAELMAARLFTTAQTLHLMATKEAEIRALLTGGNHDR